MAEEKVAGAVAAPGGRRAQGEEYWRSQVAAWRSTGLTQSEYCRREGVNWYGFRYWKAKTDAEMGLGAGGGKLVRVRGPAPSEVTGGVGIRVRVGGKYVVEVEAGFEPAVLREVIELLERR